MSKNKTKSFLLGGGYLQLYLRFDILTFKNENTLKLALALQL